jgi:predicted ATPase
MTYFQNTAFLSDLQRELEELFARIYYLGPLREYPKRRYVWSGSEPADVGRRGERAIDAILAARERSSDKLVPPGRTRRLWSLEQMLAHWLQQMGLIHSIKVDRLSKRGNIYHVEVSQSPGASPVSLPDVGFGVSQVLPVLVLCYYVPERSIVIFEQPEIHLHPSVQSCLADVFIHVALQRNVQIIVESHSEHLLNRLLRRIAEGELSPEDVALYFCEIGDRETRLLTLETDSFGNVRNWPAGFFGDRFAEVAARQEAAARRRVGEQGGVRQ